jgi:hypothetical protein
MLVSTNGYFVGTRIICRNYLTVENPTLLGGGVVRM